MLLLRRRRPYGRGAGQGQTVDWRAIEGDVDEIFRRLGKLAAPQQGSIASSASVFTVFNNSASLLTEGFVYGRNASGIVAKATAASGGVIRPKWLITATTGRNLAAQFAIILPFRIYVENPAKTYSIGSFMWLSAATAGTLTDTRPAAPNARYWMGEAAETTPGSDGRLLVDYQIFPQAT